jgi:glyoxylase-like metal-dependent hydrolase (beta-lactamase superfamily II)
LREYDPITQRIRAYKVYGTYGMTRTIWMDGRPHPPANAPHTYDGFSTGRWDGHRLIVETTHMKAAFIRRNGVAQSDRARMTEHFVRHDNYLTITTALDDPVYLDGTFVRSTDFKLAAQPRDRLPEFGGIVDGGPGANFYKCSPTDEVGGDRWEVPHYLPGESAGEIAKFTQQWGVPPEAAAGGRATLYPDYLPALREFATGRRGMAGEPAIPPTPESTRRLEALDATAVSSRHIAGQIWMVTVGGRNVAVQIGTEGVLVVNPGPERAADTLLAEIRRLAGDKPVRVVINTSGSLDVAGGNLKVGAARTPGGQRAAIMSHENASLRMSRAGMAGEALPDDVFFRGVREYYFNDEAIRIIHTPAALTDGDTIVLFRRSDVIVAGDLVSDTAYPAIAPDQGGSVAACSTGSTRCWTWRSPRGGGRAARGSSRATAASTTKAISRSSATWSRS